MKMFNDPLLGAMLSLVAIMIPSLVAILLIVKFITREKKRQSPANS
jgi:hypothetical protein